MLSGCLYFCAPLLLLASVKLFIMQYLLEHGNWTFEVLAAKNEWDVPAKARCCRNAAIAYLFISIALFIIIIVRGVVARYQHGGWAEVKEKGLIGAVARTGRSLRRRFRRIAGSHDLDLGATGLQAVEVTLSASHGPNDSLYTSCYSPHSPHSPYSPHSPSSPRPSAAPHEADDGDIHVGELSSYHSDVHVPTSHEPPRDDDTG